MDIIKDFTCFNPRACVRRDVLLVSLTNTHKRFNPRACVRRDEVEPIGATVTNVSIHAPV